MTKISKESTIYKELEHLQKVVHGHGSMSWGDCNFLNNHQAEIKEFFPDDQVFWEFAGIDESEWNARG